MRSISQAESQAAARARVAAEYTRRLGQKAAEKTLREKSRKSARGSRAEVEVANRLKDLPYTAKALEDGQISYDHARIIVNTAGKVEIDETDLADRAKEQPVDVFAQTARKHEQQRSQDDGMSRLERQKRNRQSWIKTDSDDGMTVLYGRFDPITGARIKNVLSAKTDQLWRAENPKQNPPPPSEWQTRWPSCCANPARGREVPRGDSVLGSPL